MSDSSVKSVKEPAKAKPVEQDTATYDSRVEPIKWMNDGTLVLLDQRILPLEERYVECSETRQVVDAIVKMVVRGAPAIGITAAYGVALSAKRNCQLKHEWRERIEYDLDHLAKTRPTAVNLFWALDRCRALLREVSGKRPMTASQIWLSRFIRLTSPVTSKWGASVRSLSQVSLKRRV